MSEEPPSTSELSRRMNDLKSSFDRRLDAVDRNIREGNATINRRIDELPNKELIIAMMSAYEGRQAALEEDLKEEKAARQELALKVERDLTRERENRQDKFDEVEKRQTESRRWIIGICLTIAALVISFAGVMAGILL